MRADIPAPGAYSRRRIPFRPGMRANRIAYCTYGDDLANGPDMRADHAADITYTPSVNIPGVRTIHTADGAFARAAVPCGMGAVNSTQNARAIGCIFGMVADRMAYSALARTI